MLVGEEDGEPRNEGADSRDGSKHTAAAEPAPPIAPRGEDCPGAEYATHKQRVRDGQDDAEGHSRLVSWFRLWFHVDVYWV